MKTAPRAIAAGTLLASWAACSSYESADTTPGPDAATPPVDAAPDSPSDGPTPVDAAPGDAGDEAGASLIENGGFELGCAGWSIYPADATTQTSTLAHGGSRACQLCIYKTNSFYAELFQVVALTAGQRGLGDIWARAAPDGGAPQVHLFFSTREADGGSLANVGVTSIALSDTAWTQGTSLATMPPGTASALFVAKIDGNPGECVLLDDAHAVVAP